MPRVQDGAHQLKASRSATAITAACCSSLSGAKLARSPWDSKAGLSTGTAEPHA